MTKKNILQNPTKANLIVFTLLWMVSVVLIILSVTDLFTQTVFQKRYIPVFIIVLALSRVIAKLYFNYFKNK
ncbi:hypothetical protein [Olleya marilimosa]|uniref:hypothetical protein n=1 Tax=Olleya marilimosa TaxID=272164 RepID=UPI000487B576|nr:hypothetical protein [Olleya marilimosa]